MLGMFLAALDQTVVSTAIRTIADDLHGYDLQAWATTAFLITSTISTPLYGKLSDLYGRRPFYLFAIAIFVVGSMLCGLADSMYELAAFRAIQGIGAGGLMSLALAIIGDIVPPRERSRYQGMLHGRLRHLERARPGHRRLLRRPGHAARHHRLALDLLRQRAAGHPRLRRRLRVLHLPHTRREHRIDWPGALALIVCLVPLLIVAEQGRIWGWGSGRSLLCYAIGAVGLIAFILAERAYKDDALLPLRMFKNRSFAREQHRQRRPRRRHVRRHPAAAAVPADRARLQPDRRRPADDPARRGHHDRRDGLRIDDRATGKYKIFPLIGIVFIVAALVSMSFIVDADHLGVDPGAVHGPAGPRAGLQLPADDPRRAERRLARGRWAWPPRR